MMRRTPTTLSLTGVQHVELRKHLHGGDGKEAAAILLCGQRDGDRRHRLVVADVQPIPHSVCTARSPTHVSWPTDYIAPLLNRATDQRLSVVKVHSHPNGATAFSAIDDESDKRFLPSVLDWVEADVLHGSTIMLPDGQMRGRVLDAKFGFEPIDCINVVGDDLQFWYEHSTECGNKSFLASQAQVFDDGTIERLQRLSIAVVGVSGTGSPVVEQLVRLGVGEVVLVDDDHVEERNVNRILHSTMQDAQQGKPKVEVLAEAIRRMGLGTRVIRVEGNLWSRDVVRTVGQCDVLFGCMDTVDGRYLLNKLATHYLLPYFDVGVGLIPREDQRGRSSAPIDVCHRVSYMQPGGSSLLSRGLFTMTDVSAAGLRRRDPAAFGQQVDEGYIAAVQTHRPAVISINFLAAALAVNEFLARLHPFREAANSDCAELTFDLTDMELHHDPDGAPCEMLGSHVGKGDEEPMLELPELAARS